MAPRGPRADRIAVVPRYAPPCGERAGFYGAMHLEGFDGVLAFGEVVRDAYIRRAAYDALLLGSQLNPLDEGWAGVGPANTPPVTAFRNYRGEELGIHLLSL
jgi:hypothetical protein